MYDQYNNTLFLCMVNIRFYIFGFAYLTDLFF